MVIFAENLNGPFFRIGAEDVDAGEVEAEVGDMGTGLLEACHGGVKQLVLREENGLFDGGLLHILIWQHVAESYDKGKKRCQEEPNKEVSHRILLSRR